MISGCFNLLRCIRCSIARWISRASTIVSIVSWWLKWFCRNRGGISGNLIGFASITRRNVGRSFIFILFNRLDLFKWSTFELWLNFSTLLLHSDWSIYSCKWIGLDLLSHFLSLYLSLIGVVTHSRTGLVRTVIFSPLVRRIDLDFLMRKLILIFVDVCLVCAILCIELALLNI